VQGPADSGDLKAYAVRAGAGAISVVVINKRAEARTVSVKIAGGVKAKSATVVRLEASAIDAKSGVTLGGAEVSVSGAWEVARTEKVSVADSSIELHLPAYSAAVAQIKA
jgi:alpha-L-arabinofuranosidase